MGKKKTLRDHASELADTLAPHVEVAREKAAPLLADARDKAAPVLAEARVKAAPLLADAREKAAPVLADARDKAAPVLADAREKAAPYVADARDRFTTEVLPVVTAAVASVDAATQEARAETLKRGKAVAAALKGEVEAPQEKHRGRFLLILLGIGGAVFAGVRVLGNRRATTNWQSSYTPPPAPTTPSTTTTSPGPVGDGLVAGSEGGLHRAEASPDDTAASDPAEAVSDATDVPHPSSTPDNPVTEVDVDRE
jgi:vacuolar-type H+-ATPase subunit H